LTFDSFEHAAPHTHWQNPGCSQRQGIVAKLSERVHEIHSFSCHFEFIARREFIECCNNVPRVCGRVRVLPTRVYENLWKRGAELQNETVKREWISVLPIEVCAVSAWQSLHASNFVKPSVIRGKELGPRNCISLQRRQYIAKSRHSLPRDRGGVSKSSISLALRFALGHGSQTQGDPASSRGSRERAADEHNFLGPKRLRMQSAQHKHA